MRKFAGSALSVFEVRMKEKKQYLKIDEIHAVLLDILSEFDRLCRENGLRYSLAYGTLLGAVRHKGFIPWDDDVDVVMPRPDYEKLHDLLAAGQILNEPFVFSEDRGKKAEYPFMKLMDDRYRIKSRTHIEVPHPYIDIFPLDGYSEKKGKKLHRKFMVLDFCLDMTRWYILDRWWMYPLRILCFWWYLPFLIWGRHRIVAKINRIAQAYPFGEHELVDCTSWGATSDEVPRSFYDSYCELPFEGRKFFAVSEWDQWLTMRYGDYMTPPPKNKQITHCMKIYKIENGR